jgi:zinc transporter 2
MDVEKQSLHGSERKENDSVEVPKSRASPIVFCVHGNKWEMAQCCETLSDDDLARHFHQDRDKGVNKEAKRKLILVSVLCILLMTGEVVGGVLANSLAIATNAAHLLTDFASFMISLFAMYMASKPPSQKMNFGWHRAEVLGAVVSVLLIWVVTGVLVYLAIERIVNASYEIDALLMLITSGVGFFINIVMGCSLHQHGHSHGPGTREPGHSHKEGNINVKAAFIHVIGDFLQSLGVLVAAIVIYFRPDLGIIDPICTLVFSVLVLATTIKILGDIVRVIMEDTASGFDYSGVRDMFLSVDGKRQIHNLRIWSITTDKTALAAHLAVEKGIEPQWILAESTTKIREKYNLFEVTLQVQEFKPGMAGCVQ